MILDGALEDVDAIFAIHVSHEHPTGIIGSRPGPLLAGCGFFRAVIRGNLRRHVDPLLAASAAVISLQGIVSREANPLDSQVCLCVFTKVAHFSCHLSKFLPFLDKRVNTEYLIEIFMI